MKSRSEEISTEIIPTAWRLPTSPYTEDLTTATPVLVADLEVWVRIHVLARLVGIRTVWAQVSKM